MRGFVRIKIFSGFTLTIYVSHRKMIESSLPERENGGASNERGAVTGAV